MRLTKEDGQAYARLRRVWDNQRKGRDYCELDGQVWRVITDGGDVVFELQSSNPMDLYGSTSTGKVIN